VNTVIQGSAADIIKLAMVRLHVLLEDTPANLLLSVHDELVVVAPDDYVEQTMELMEEAMIIDGILDVPLSVEAKAGQSWAEAK
jgi:DNA polymerase-1